VKAVHRRRQMPLRSKQPGLQAVQQYNPAVQQYNPAVQQTPALQSSSNSSSRVGLGPLVPQGRGLRGVALGPLVRPPSRYSSRSRQKLKQPLSQQGVLRVLRQYGGWRS
jgi:hypothetical protein